MIDAYCALHRLGVAHSVEIYRDGELCGGLYGVSIGSQFAGESMFSGQPNASKVALGVLVEFARQHNIEFIDCQIANPHLCSLGAEEIARSDFIRLVQAARERETIPAPWSRLGHRSIA